MLSNSDESPIAAPLPSFTPCVFTSNFQGLFREKAAERGLSGVVFGVVFGLLCSGPARGGVSAQGELLRQTRKVVGSTQSSQSPGSSHRPGLKWADVAKGGSGQ